jgi:hypothetical protein
VKHQSLELLRFNYSNLHESLWESHKVAWTVTGLFIPVIFALQGYLAKKYVLSTEPLVRELVAGVVISELLLSVWRLMLWVLEHYNNQRLDRLRAIEKVFAEEFVRREREGGKYASFLSRLVKQSELVRQYRGFSYRRKIPYVKISLSWNRIYSFIAILITIVNIGSIIYCKSGIWAALIAICVIIILCIVGWACIRRYHNHDIVK